MSLEIIGTPFSEVQRAFDGYQPRPGINSYGYVTNRVTLNKPGATDGSNIYAPNYHSESDYDPVQRKLVHATIGCLNALTRGIVLGDASHETAPFSQRIIENFMAQDDSRSFSRALCDSSLELGQEFSKHHSNLIPAFRIVMENGGSSGFVRALTPMRIALGLALDGSLTEDNKDVFFSTDHSLFVAKFPYLASSLEWERWCSAESLVESMILKAKEAALELAKDSTATHNYHPETDTNDLDTIRSLRSSLEKQARYLCL